MPALLAFLSAVAATSHEVVWGRFVARAVGNTAWGIALALGIFMVGMGAGALIARRLLARRWSPRRTYVAAEIAIGLFSTIAARALLGAGLPSSGLAGTALPLAVDLAWAALLCGIPALAIGATYPLLVAAVVRSDADARSVGGLYRAGLAGGVVGVLATAAFLAPRIGLDGAAIAAAATNLLVAAIASRVLPTGAGATDPAGEIDPELRKATLLFVAAGALGLGAQVVWNRTLLPYAGVSTLTFSMIVAVYLLAQAIGMTWAARKGAREDFAQWALAAAPPVAILSLAPLGPLGAIVPSRDLAPWTWLATSAAIVAVAVAPTAALLGVVQAHALRRVETESHGWARSVAWVSGVGTIGSAIVATAASIALYPTLGPRGTLAALGVVAVLALARRIPVAVSCAVASGALVVVAPGPRWFLGPEFDAAPMLWAEHGVQDTVAILERDLPVEPGIRRLVSNGTSYSGDSLFAQRYMRLLAHLPALAAKGERRALVVCIGTGSTAAALSSYRTRVDAVDVSPSVRRMLPFFRPVNAGMAEAHVVIEDGERFLRRTRDRYDVITLEPPPPRAPGASALYSREFYEAARARLSPGGVLAQWLPLHGITGWEARAIVRTFGDAFPHATLHLAERNEAILLGGLDGAHLEESDPARLASPRVRTDLRRIGMDDEDPLLETLVAKITPRMTAGAATIRWAWPAPELAPFAGPSGGGSLDEFADSLVSSSPATFAGTLLPAVAPFIRIQEGRAAADDRTKVADALVTLLRRDPADPYVQYMMAFGDYLAARLPRGETRIRARIEKQRHWAHERAPRRAGRPREADPRERHLTNIRQLTNGGENAEAYWAPDGRRLIMQVTRGRGTCDQEYVLDVVTGEERLVSTGRGRTTCGYFVYPAGDAIVYSSSHEVDAACPAVPDRSQGYVWPLYEYDIFRASADGTGLHELLGGPGYDAEATMAFDGSRIVFTSTRDADLELYTMAPDGSDVRRLTTTPGYDGGAFFSPDSKRLVWRASRPVGQALEDYRALLARNLVRPTALEIFVGNADGTDARQVTHNGAANFAPYFLPDSRRVIWASNMGGSPREFDLWMVDTESDAEPERVTFAEGFDGFPMFSPDGKWLAWGSNRHGENEGDTNVFVAEWVE